MSSSCVLMFARYRLPNAGCAKLVETITSFHGELTRVLAHGGAELSFADAFVPVVEENNETVNVYDDIAK